MFFKHVLYKSPIDTEPLSPSLHAENRHFIYQPLILKITDMDIAQILKSSFCNKWLQSWED